MIQRQISVLTINLFAKHDLNIKFIKTRIEEIVCEEIKELKKRKEE